MNKPTEVVSFQFDSQEVRSIINQESGEPWFVAADVCGVLGHTNTTVALASVDEDEKAKKSLGLSGGDTNIISESGLYVLIMRSNKPEAKRFRKWVTSEVLPAIRKTGSYSATPSRRSDMPDTIEPMVNQLKQSVEAAKIFGLHGDDMFDFAERAVVNVTGYSMKTVFGMNEWPKQQQRPVLTLPVPPVNPVDPAYTVTQLSMVIGGGIGARGLNKLLCQKGVQERHYNDDGVIFYTPTDKGKPYASFFDVTKKDGNKIQQLKWKPGVACLVS